MRPHRFQSNDPRWMNARYAGLAQGGTPFKAGDRVLYYPLSRSFLIGDEAEKNWREFQSAAADESFMSGC